MTLKTSLEERVKLILSYADEQPNVALADMLSLIESEKQESYEEGYRIAFIQHESNPKTVPVINVIQ